MLVMFKYIYNTLLAAIKNIMKECITMTFIGSELITISVPSHYLHTYCTT